MTEASLPRQHPRPRSGGVASSLLVLFGLLWIGCTSASFVPFGSESAAPPRAGVCSAAVLEEPPADRSFVRIGFCTIEQKPSFRFSIGAVSAPHLEPVAEYTDAEIRKLRQCACRNGGNAIILSGADEIGMHLTSEGSQPRVKPHAIVLYVFPEGR